MVAVTDEARYTKDRLAKDMAGEIVLSESPEQVIRKWREIFKISQKTLASKLSITSSVISDYESGRRSSPGIRVIKKYVNALLAIDNERGGGIIRSFSKSAPRTLSDAIIDMREFGSGMNIGRFCKKISASMLVERGMDKPVYGYTIIDSFKAITEFSFEDLVKLYGPTTQRALIFTKVTTGRTPMVAMKLTNLHPALVVLHGLDSVDDVAKRIAEVEGIPLALCRLDDINRVTEKLKK